MDQVILRLLGVLEQLHEEKGVPQQQSLVDKNVIKSDKSTFDSSDKKKAGLDSSDKKTLVETFNLFNQMFFDYQKKMNPDTADKTKLSEISRKQATPPPLPQQQAEEKGSGLLSMILGGLGLLAASVGGIIASLSGFFGDAGSKVLEAVGKLGMIGALKILSKTVLKKFSLKALKKLPFIGGIVGFYFAYKAFKEGNIFKGVGELISAFLNFVPGIGPYLSIGADLLIAWADSKGMFSEGGSLSPANGWKTIKGWMGVIGKTIMDNALYLPIIGTFKRFGMSYDAFKGGNVGEGLKQMGLGLLTILPGGGALIKGMEVLAGWFEADKQPDSKFNTDKSWFGKMKQWLVKKLKDLPGVLKAPLRWFGILDDEGDTSTIGASALKGATDGAKGIMSFVGGVWDKMKDPIKNTVDGLGQFASDAWGITKDFTSKAWDKAKEAGSWFANAIGDMANKTKDMINQWIPKIVDTISGMANSAMDVLKSIASKIGGWIADLFTSDEETKLKQVSKQTKEKEKMLTSNDEASHMLVKTNITQNMWLENMYKASTEQVKLLGMLVNVGNSQLSELKRMSGNGSGGGHTTIVTSPQQSPKTQKVSMGNNRSGFSTSAYALG